jgi:hypothetical protein
MPSSNCNKKFSVFTFNRIPRAQAWVYGVLSWLSLFLCFACLQTHAQRLPVHQANSWLATTTQIKLSPKWGIHGEWQWRQSQLVQRPQQALWRMAALYQALPHLQWAGGFILLRNYPYGAYPAKSIYPEFRLWEQLQVKNTVHRWDTWLRLRLEQRWSYTPVLMGAQYEPGHAVYSNRIRIMNKWNHPLASAINKNPLWYLSFYNEVFLSFGKQVKVNMLDQNRIGIALGNKRIKNANVELGYMLQTIIKSDGIHVEQNHTLSLACFTSLSVH